METNDKALNSDKAIDRLIEFFRLLHSHKLKEFIGEKTNRNIFKNKEEKISWELIRLYLPYNIEKYIKQEYEMLTDNEIRLCCLLIFDVSIKNIHNILKYSKKSIYSVTYGIKKKAGIKEINEIFRKIILNFISINGKVIIL